MPLLARGARRVDLIAAVLTAGLAASIYLPMLFAGAARWGLGDWYLLAFRHEWVRKSVFDYGQFPLRSHFVGGGYPTLGDPEDPTLSPITWLLLPFNGFTALKLRYVLAAAASGGGVFLLLRRPLGMTRWGALYGGLLFAWAPWLPWQVRGGNANELYPALVPLALLLWLTAPKRPWRFAALPVLFYLVLTDGKQQLLVVALFLGIVSGVWWLQNGGRAWAPAALAAAALAFTAWIGMVRVLPALEVLSRRGGALYPEVVLHGGRVTHCSFVQYVRNLAGLSGRDHFGDLFYLGPSAVLLALAGLAAAPRKLLAWAIAAVLFVWLLLGENAPVNLLAALTRLPFFHLLDWPAKYLAPYVVLFAAAAGAAAFSPLLALRPRWLARGLAAAAMAAILVPLAVQAVRFTRAPFTEPLLARAAGPPRDFYAVSLANEVHGDNPLPSNCYYNLMRNVGTIDWGNFVPLPTSAQPRYWIEPDGGQRKNPRYRGEAWVLGGAGRCHAVLTPNRIVVVAELDKPDVVVINQNHHPGWSAEGGRLEKHRGLLAVRFVRPGRQVAVLRYWPASFCWGLVLSAAGVVALAAVTWAWASGRLPAAERLAQAAPRFAENEPFAGRLQLALATLALAVGLGAPWAAPGFVDRAAIELAERGARLWKTDQPDAARRCFLQAIQADPRNRTALAYLAQDAERRGEREAAVAYYTRYLELAPGDLNARYRRGAQCAELGRYEQALRDFSSVLEQAPNHFFARLDRGIVYLILRRFDLALPDLHRAIELKPNSALAHLHRARAFAALGEPRRAAEDLRRAASLDPNGVGRAARAALGPLEAGAP